jgi:hypothetical protein
MTARAMSQSREITSGPTVARPQFGALAVFSERLGGFVDLESHFSSSYGLPWRLVFCDGGLPVTARAQEANSMSPEELSQRTLQRRAVEAAIWACARKCRCNASGILP